MRKKQANKKVEACEYATNKCRRINTCLKTHMGEHDSYGGNGP